MFNDNSYAYKIRLERENVAVQMLVCDKACNSSHGSSKKRVERLQKTLKVTGRYAKDMRGKHGNYPRALPDETKNAVMDHIRSFKGRESHYSLKKSSKLYLSEELNIKKNA